MVKSYLAAAEMKKLDQMLQSILLVNCELMPNNSEFRVNRILLYDSECEKLVNFRYWTLCSQS